jgi:hypothetical protein
MPMPAPSLPLFYAVSPTAPATVTASSSSTTQSDVLPLMTDLTHAEIERRLGKRSVIDSSSGVAAFYSFLPSHSCDLSSPSQPTASWEQHGCFEILMPHKCLLLCL